MQANLGLSPDPLIKRGRADSQINFLQEHFASPNLNNAPTNENNLDDMLADN